MDQRWAGSSQIGLTLVNNVQGASKLELCGPTKCSVQEAPKLDSCGSTMCRKLSDYHSVWTYLANPENLCTACGPAKKAASANSANPSDGTCILLHITCEHLTYKMENNYH
jgi:hypothetical protein